MRVGVNSGGNPDATKLYTFTDCSLKSQNEDGDAVVIIRKDAEKASFDFVNTELIGDPVISGYTDATNVNGIPMPQRNNEIWYTSDMKLVPTNPEALDAAINALLTASQIRSSCR